MSIKQSRKLQRLSVIGFEKEEKPDGLNHLNGIYQKGIDRNE